MVKLKILALLAFASFAAALLLTDNVANPHARAYSSGPPAGFSRAPGELDCSDCHTTPAQSAGSVALGVPQTYTPGQTYDITVAHTTADPTRVRWGFQLTALDAADERAGGFEPVDDLTRVIFGEGPFPSREYVEHTTKGTFSGQQNNAGWTFKWTAPSEDVGPVTFYLAGNQANGDGNSSGDNIYFTFASAVFQPPTPDFQLTVTPSPASVHQGGTKSFNVRVTPSGRFTGQVALSVSGLPPETSELSSTDGVTEIDNALPRVSFLHLTTSSATPVGDYTFSVTATSGQLTRTVQVPLKVVALSDADLAVSQTVSPNPAQANADLRFSVTLTNNGPATATAVNLIVQLPTDIGA